MAPASLTPSPHAPGSWTPSPQAPLPEQNIPPCKTWQHHKQAGQCLLAPRRTFLLSLGAQPWLGAALRRRQGGRRLMAVAGAGSTAAAEPLCRPLTLRPTLRWRPAASPGAERWGEGSSRGLAGTELSSRRMSRSDPAAGREGGRTRLWKPGFLVAAGYASRSVRRRQGRLLSAPGCGFGAGCWRGWGAGASSATAEPGAASLGRL